MSEKKRISNGPVIARVETRAVPAREVRADPRADRVRRQDRDSHSGRHAVTEDVVGVTSLSALRSETERPPSNPSLSSEGDRIARLVAELGEATPGLEGPPVSALLRFGEGALHALSAAFPGTVWFNRQQTATRLPKGRGVSGIAAGLVEFGARALPHVYRLLEDPDADKRYFALLVCAELGPEDLPERVVRLVCDPDAGVSNIAILAIKAHGGVPSTRRALEQLYGFLQHPNPPIVPLLRTFGVLRDPGCVPHVAGLLDHPNPQLVEAAERVLRAITARDLGRKPKRWLAWHKRHARKTRAEWLLAAARSLRVVERALAAEELQQLTGETCGFDPSGGWRARRQALTRYRAQLAASGDLAPRDSGVVERTPRGTGRDADSDVG